MGYRASWPSATAAARFVVSGVRVRRIRVERRPCRRQALPGSTPRSRPGRYLGKGGRFFSPATPGCRLRYLVQWRTWETPRRLVQGELDGRGLRRLKGDVMWCKPATPNPRTVAARAFGQARKL